MYPDCLKDLVGLVHFDTDCLDSTDISNVSTLDLFVSQDVAYDNCRLKGGDTTCDLIKLMDECREEALKKIAVDLGAVLSEKIKTRKADNYFIGQNEFGPYLSPSLIPAQPEISIFTEYQPGAFVRIDKVALMIYPKAGPMDVELKFYKVFADNDLEESFTRTIHLERNDKTPYPIVSVTLPCDGFEYRVSYNYNSATMDVPDSNYHCSCGDKLKSARGFIKENPSKTYGISLYTTLLCASGLSVCSLLNNDDYRLVIAHMIRKVTILMLLQKIYYRQEVNRYTLLSSEDAKNQIVTYDAEYNTRLTWFTSQKNFEVDGFCLTCKTGGMGGSKLNLLTGRKA